MPKTIFLKLPFDVKTYTKKEKTVKVNNTDSGNSVYVNCDECIKQATDLAIPPKKFCPNCPEPTENKEEEVKEVEGKDYILTKTYDYVRFQDIENFISFSKDTVTVFFCSGKVMSYKLTEKMFLKMISKLITVIL